MKISTPKHHKFNSLFIIWLYLSYCVCYGFCIDFFLNLIRYHLELTLTFRLMIAGKLGLPVTLIILSFNLFILLVLFIGHAKIMLKDMRSRVLLPDAINLKHHDDIHLIINSICQQINLNESPTIHLADVAFPNAFVFGFGSKFQNLVITTGLLKLLNEEELQAVLTHQLLSIKLEISTLATTVALISHLMLIIYDSIWYNSMYRASLSSSKHSASKKALRAVRFFIPISTLYFRYFLDPNRIKLLDGLTIDEVSSQTLINALIKIEDCHKDNQVLMGKFYTNIRYNEVRRDSFLFDPAEYNYAQTMGLPFTTHLSIKERISQL